MGDAVRVRLSRVDLAQRQIDFEMVDGSEGASHGTVRAPRRGGGGGGSGRRSGGSSSGGSSGGSRRGGGSGGGGGRRRGGRG
jgi:hypothetical protein